VWRLCPPAGVVVEGAVVVGAVAGAVAACAVRGRSAPEALATRTAAEAATTTVAIAALSVNRRGLPCHFEPISSSYARFDQPIHRMMLVTAARESRRKRCRP
jgi:hypothetical protein